jgi:hypothetical protein
MSSIRRILSSRANGSLSKGPVTAEGKRRSSRNAIRHGLLAGCVVLPGESPEAFEKLVACHYDRFCPGDEVEAGLVEEMSASYWRLRRAWAMETNLFTQALAPPAPGGDLDRITSAFRQLACSSELPLLHRYEARLHLMYQRALAALLLLRSCAPADAPEEDPPCCPQ